MPTPPVSKPVTCPVCGEPATFTQRDLGSELMGSAATSTLTLVCAAGCAPSPSELDRLRAGTLT